MRTEDGVNTKDIIRVEECGNTDDGLSAEKGENMEESQYGEMIEYGGRLNIEEMINGTHEAVLTKGTKGTNGSTWRMRW